MIIHTAVGTSTVRCPKYDEIAFVTSRSVNILVLDGNRTVRDDGKLCCGSFHVPYLGLVSSRFTSCTANHESL